MRAAFSPSYRGRLTDRDLDRFPDDTLFHRIARAVCHAGCLPRKELYESWEMARRVRRLLRGGRVVDLAGGHGLLAQVMLLLDDSSPDALVVDTTLPPSSATLHEVLAREWPRLTGRVSFVTSRIDAIDLDAGADTRCTSGGPEGPPLQLPRPERRDEGADLQVRPILVSSHACGALTDQVLDRAIAARARVALLPCCHDFETCDDGGLAGWVDRALAIDVTRAVRLERQGYRVWTQTIPSEITPKHRLLLGEPLNGRP